MCPFGIADDVLMWLISCLDWCEDSVFVKALYKWVNGLSAGPNEERSGLDISHHSCTSAAATQLCTKWCTGFEDVQFGTYFVQNCHGNLTLKVYCAFQMWESVYWFKSFGSRHVSDTGISSFLPFKMVLMGLICYLEAIKFNQVEPSRRCGGQMPTGPQQCCGDTLLTKKYVLCVPLPSVLSMFIACKWISVVQRSQYSFALCLLEL